MLPDTDSLVTWKSAVGAATKSLLVGLCLAISRLPTYSLKTLRTGCSCRIRLMCLSKSFIKKELVIVGFVMVITGFYAYFIKL